MNQIIIIGNGFDLAHGMPTRYSDFMLHLLKKHIVLAYNSKKKKTVDGPINITSFVQFGDSTIEDYVSKSTTLDDLIKDQWLDINFPKNKTFEIRIRNAPQSPSRRKGIEIKINSPLILTLLSNHRNGNWIDIETEYFSYINNALNEKNLDDRRKRIIQVNKDLEFLKRELCEYLKTVQLDEQEYDQTSINTKFEEKMMAFLFPRKTFKSGNLHGDFKRLIVNYNYTSTVERYLEKINSAGAELKTEISYIHGSLNDSKSEIIFGFGSVDGPELKNILSSGIHESSENLKFLIYHRNGQDDTLNKVLRNGAFKVRIVGHSCGLSDGSTLREIFAHRDCQSISVCYLNENEFFEKTYNIYTQLKEFKKLPIEAMNKDLCFTK
ncbi:MAG: hypothetical protein Roseis2KO_45720 [Roseivirga sp.]